MLQEPQTPYKTALWAKTKEPRMAPLPQKHYALHVQRSVDPYDSVSKVNLEHSDLSGARLMHIEDKKLIFLVC